MIARRNFDLKISVPPPSGMGQRSLPSRTFGKKILIVDDNRLVRTATRRALLARRALLSAAPKPISGHCCQLRSARFDFQRAAALGTPCSA